MQVGYALRSLSTLSTLDTLSAHNILWPFTGWSRNAPLSDLPASSVRHIYDFTNCFGYGSRIIFRLNFRCSPSSFLVSSCERCEWRWRTFAIFHIFSQPVARQAHTTYYEWAFKILIAFSDTCTIHMYVAIVVAVVIAFEYTLCLYRNLFLGYWRYSKLIFTDLWLPSRHTNFTLFVAVVFSFHCNLTWVSVFSFSFPLFVFTNFLLPQSVFIDLVYVPRFIEQEFSFSACVWECVCICWSVICSITDCCHKFNELPLRWSANWER